MSKAEILNELPRLRPEERQEIFQRICEIEEGELLCGATPTAEERALLDRELEEYRQNPDVGSLWQKVEGRFRQPVAG